MSHPAQGLSSQLGVSDHPAMPPYRLHSTAGDDLGLLEHPARNLEPGDMVELADGRQGLVTARVETDEGPLAALLEVLIAPSSPDIPDPGSPP